MTSRSTVRTPPRRRSARRIAAVFLLALIVMCATPGRLDAYPCNYAGGARIVNSDCAPPKPRPKKRVPGEPSVLSLTLFVAALVGVLAVPITYYRTGAVDPE
jgi:hypothetical protein